ncbi:MAG: hypothetical protein H8Z69_04455 [Nanohaloarchaea archaeon]|nr:hypothetical protein [Candidatus Nanohaloarchaea archaeon]
MFVPKNRYDSDRAVYIRFGIIGIAVGFLLSQYFPIWGGILTLGEPFSPARLRLAVGHMIVFGLLGILGAYLKTKDR